MSSGSIDDETSKRIKVIRVLCISFITYVHLQPGQKYIDLAPEYLNIIRYFFIIILGSASVPILSIISGYIFYEIQKNNEWKGYVTKRFFSLYVPMVIWSAITALTLYVLNMIGYGGLLFERLESMSLINSVFAVWDRPINYPLYFLRDIFVISIFAPLFRYLELKFVIEIILFISVLMYFFNVGYPIIIRPMTLLFFVFGVYLSMRKVRIRQLDQYSLLIMTSIVFLLTALSFYDFNSRPLEMMFETARTTDLIFRILLSVLIWNVSLILITGKAWKFFRFAEKYIFTMFLTHLITIIFAGGTFRVVFSDYAGPEYLVLFVTAPIYCFIGALTIHQIVSWLPDRLYRLILVK